MSLDQMVAAYDAQPRVHAMLARHGLTAREEILGMLTLMFAGLEIAQQEHPGVAKSGGTAADQPRQPGVLQSARSGLAPAHQRDHPAATGGQPLQAAGLRAPMIAHLQTHPIG